MPGQRISQLSSSYASTLAGDDLFPVVSISGSIASPFPEVKGMETDELIGFLAGEITGSVSTLSNVVSQSAHGFVVGSVVRWSGGQFVSASPSDFVSAFEIGLVYSVPSANEFLIAYEGIADVGGGVAPGVVYYLSETGTLTPTDPSLTNSGYQSKPVAIGRDTTSVYVFNQRSLSTSTFFKVLGLSNAPLRYNNGLEMAPTQSVSCYSDLKSDQLIGTDDFSIFFVVKLPPKEFAPKFYDQVLFALSPSKTNPYITDAGLVVALSPVSSTRTDLIFKFNSAPGFQRVSYEDVLENYADSIISVCFIRDVGSNTRRVFINGEEVATTAYNTPAAGSWNNTLNNTSFSINRNVESTAQLAGFSALCFYLYNKALTADEVKSNHFYGISSQDKWGSNQIFVSGSLSLDHWYRIVTLPTGSNEWDQTTDVTISSSVGFEWLVTKDVADPDFGGGTLKRVGCNFALEPESVQPGLSQWKDVSAYRTHVVRPETGSATLRPVYEFVLDYELSAEGYFGETGNPRDILPPGAVITSYRFFSSQSVTMSLGSAPNDSSRLAPFGLTAGSWTSITPAGYILPSKRIYLNAPGLSQPLRTTMEGYVAEDSGESLTTPFTSFAVDSFGAFGITESGSLLSMTNDNMTLGFVLEQSSNRTLSFTATKTTGTWARYDWVLWRNGSLYSNGTSSLGGSTYTHNVPSLPDGVYTYALSINNSCGDEDTVSVLVQTVGNSTGVLANCSVRAKAKSTHAVSLTPTGSFFNTKASASFDDITNGTRTINVALQLNGVPTTNPFVSTLTGDAVKFEGFYNGTGSIISIVQVQTIPFGTPFSGLTPCS